MITFIKYFVFEKNCLTALLQDSSLFADALEAGSKVNEPRKRKRASKDGGPDPLVAPVSAPALSPPAMKPEPVESPAQISPTAIKPMFKVTPMMTSFEEENHFANLQIRLEFMFGFSFLSIMNFENYESFILSSLTDKRMLLIIDCCTSVLPRYAGSGRTEGRY